ncbi:hypothetical protein [Yinghuangia sp. YIM S09857]|uniref:hypothetical protein n=1 Tax=Yinghuangia sp. YIM S09857 TaxID=3436929 RepID=UPI003F52A14D
MNPDLTAALLAVGDQPNNTPSTTPAAGSVTLGTGVVIFVVAFFLIKLGTGKAGWVLMAIAGVMLADTQLGGLVGQFGAQLAVSGVNGVTSLFT